MAPLGRSYERTGEHVQGSCRWSAGRRCFAGARHRGLRWRQLERRGGSERHARHRAAQPAREPQPDRRRQRLRGQPEVLQRAAALRQGPDRRARPRERDARAQRRRQDGDGQAARRRQVPRRHAADGQGRRVHVQRRSSIPDSASPMATPLDTLEVRHRDRRHDRRVQAQPRRSGLLRQAADRDRPGRRARGQGHQDRGVQPQADRHRALRPQGVPARRADRHGVQPGLLPRRAEDQAHRADRGRGRERSRRIAREGHGRRRRHRPEARRPRAPNGNYNVFEVRTADARVAALPNRDPVLRDAAVRRALSYAVDRQKIVDSALGGRRRAGLRPDHEGSLGVLAGRRARLRPRAGRAPARRGRLDAQAATRRGRRAARSSRSPHVPVQRQRPQGRRSGARRRR